MTEKTNRRFSAEQKSMITITIMYDKEGYAERTYNQAGEVLQNSLKLPYPPTAATLAPIYRACGITPAGSRTKSPSTVEDDVKFLADLVDTMLAHGPFNLSKIPMEKLNRLGDLSGKNQLSKGT